MNTEIVSVSEKVYDALTKAKAIAKRYNVNGLNQIIVELELLMQIFNNSKMAFRNKEGLMTICKIADYAIEDLNKTIKEYFLSKLDVAKTEDILNKDVSDKDLSNEDIENAIDFIESSFDESVLNSLCFEDIITIANNILYSSKKIDEEREKKQKGKGQKVKRVPPVTETIDQIASILGYDGISKISVNHAKPIFQVKKDDKNCISYMIRNNENSQNNNEVKINTTENKSPIEVVEKFEALVGKFTTEKLAADRRLQLAKQALDTANNHLMKLTLNDLVNDNSFNNLKRDFDKALDEVCNSQSCNKN